MLSLDKPFVVSDFIQATQADTEVIVLDLEKESFFGLNEVGTRVWNELAQGRTLQEVITMLCEEFEVAPQVVQSDVTRLVENFIDKGWMHQADVVPDRI